MRVSGYACTAINPLHIIIYISSQSDLYFVRVSIVYFYLACPDSFEEVESRTSDSFLSRTRGNLEEVELCLTAGGSPKGNTCGLSHLPSIDLEGVEPRMVLSWVHGVLGHCVLPGHRDCSGYV